MTDQRSAARVRNPDARWRFWCSRLRLWLAARRYLRHYERIDRGADWREALHHQWTNDSRPLFQWSVLIVASVVLTLIYTGVIH